MKKLTPKQATLCAIGIVILGLILALVGLNHDHENRLLVGIGFAVMFASIVFRLVFCRCPHCDHLVGGISEEFCPHCGKKLNEK